jgi:hypothetical protein
MGEWVFSGAGGLRVFARSRHSGTNACDLRPEDDFTSAQNLGGRRANARRGGFCGRKNNFACGYRRFGLGVDQTGKRNWEVGLDESNLFPAALMPFASRDREEEPYQDFGVEPYPLDRVFPLAFS